jgi:hypothetical protein
MEIRDSQLKLIVAGARGFTFEPRSLTPIEIHRKEDASQ